MNKKRGHGRQKSRVRRILLPHRAHHNMVRQTYPLALGNSIHDHSAAESYFLDQAKTLMNEGHDIFCCKEKTKVRVVAIP